MAARAETQTTTAAAPNLHPLAAVVSHARWQSPEVVGAAGIYFSSRWVLRMLSVGRHRVLTAEVGCSGTVLLGGGAAQVAGTLCSQADGTAQQLADRRGHMDRETIRNLKGRSTRPEEAQGPRQASNLVMAAECVRAAEMVEDAGLLGQALATTGEWTMLQLR